MSGSFFIRMLVVALTLSVFSTSAADAPRKSTFASDPLAAFDPKYKAMPMDALLKAARSGDGHAQYAYWIRECAEAESLADPWFKLNSSNFRALRGEARARYIEEAEKMAPKWKDASDEELKKAASGGDMIAADYMNQRMQSAMGARQSKAVEWLKKSASLGVPQAEFQMGIMSLQRGNLIPPNSTNGLSLLLRAAAQGMPEAQYKLGTIYLEGEIVPPDPARAVEFFRPAADQGGPMSLYELALLYESGDGLPRNPADSPLELLKRSFENGNITAGLHIAMKYRTGLGVGVDYVKAIRYYLKARSNQPYDLSEKVFVLLDSTLEPATGIEPEFVPFAHVFSTYSKAVYRKDAEAIASIGELYLRGSFVPEDKVEACRWFSFAASLGNKSAGEKYDKIFVNLTSGEKLLARVTLNEATVGVAR